MTGKVHFVACALIVHDRKVLLLLHTKLKKWLPPGGHIEENETPDEAIVREVKEETGIDFKFFGMKKSPVGDEIAVGAIPLYANRHNVGDHDHYCFYYLGTPSNPTFVKNHESTDMKWFALDEIKNQKNVPESIVSIAKLAVETIDNA